jgi:phage repressor protein C with HTH and peptisase S24 domain
MCQLYSVTDIQAEFRGVDTMFTNYSRLNSLGKSRVQEYVSILSDNPMFSEQDSMVMEASREYIRLYDAPVAAGTGSFLDSDAYEEFEIDETVPRNTDYAVRVSGDSMEPRFVDGQIIFIKEQQVLNFGDVGIFSINGDAYVKKLGNDEFISLNPIYKPIKIKEHDYIHIFGKVLG